MHCTLCMTYCVYVMCVMCDDGIGEGPAYIRALRRRPMIKYKNLSEAEVKRIQKSRDDKVLFNKILER